MENLLIQNDLTEQREGFKINSLESANWAFRKLRALDNKITEIDQLAAEEISRIETWNVKECEELEKDKEYFEFLLSEYFKEEKAKDKKFKLSTPYGKITMRKSKTWNYEDQEALVKYLKDNDPELIRVKEELNKTELKKIYKDGVNKETGEILPFVSIEETESISVKVEL